MSHEESHNQASHLMDRNELENLIGQQIANAIPRIVEAIRQNVPVVSHHTNRNENNIPNSHPRTAQNNVTHRGTHQENLPPSRRRSRPPVSHSVCGENTDVVKFLFQKEEKQPRVAPTKISWTANQLNFLDEKEQ